jgi:phosphonatase-like hydrolase
VIVVGEIELVVFDVAGTTLRDSGQVAEAFRQTLAAHGVALGSEDLKPWRGAAKRRALEHFLERRFGAVTPDRLEEVHTEFCDRLRHQYEVDPASPIEGADETFAWLRARGLRLALTTGFDRAVADLLLGAVGWDGRTINTVVCGDEVPHGRPAPYMIFRAMERTGVLSVRGVVNVGDTALDLASGWNAGVAWNIGVLSGAHDREQLRQAPHTHLLPSVAELPALFVTGDASSGPLA